MKIALILNINKGGYDFNIYPTYDELKYNKETPDITKGEGRGDF